uniref:protein NLP6-like n=1 Tax=Erigeron canadensis TaxID=72917 RepID=UPI001CB902AD|nr:protein NLP6-like [Erigeron canadensis]
MAVELLETLKEAITTYTALSPNTFFTVIAAGIAVYYVFSVLFAARSTMFLKAEPGDESEVESSTRTEKNLQENVLLPIPSASEKIEFEEISSPISLSVNEMQIVDNYMAPSEQTCTTLLPLEVTERLIGIEESTQNHNEPSDQSDALDVENSTECEKIPQKNILLPKPSARKYKRTPIILCQDAIEHQYGNTMKKAAKNLNVSISTLKRKCKDFGISEWQGPTAVNKKVNDSSLQSDTDEEDVGAIREPAGNRNIAPSARKYKTAPILLSQEAIEQQYGNTMLKAAKNLNVSISTLKRKCKKVGISEWQGPSAVKRKVNNSSNQSDTDEEDIGALHEPSAVNRNKDNLTIKAEYAGDMIKFHLHIIEATFETVMDEISTRFKLTPGSYKVKYLDEDKDRILLTSEQDLSDCIKTSRSSDQTAVRLHVESLHDQYPV